MKLRHPLLRDYEKASSLRKVIAIRHRQIEPFPFLNEEYKQSSLWAWLALSTMPTRGAFKRSFLKVVDRPSSSALVSIQPTSSRWFCVAWPVLFIYIARRYLQNASHTSDILPFRSTSTTSASLIRVNQSGSLLLNTHICPFRQIT